MESKLKGRLAWVFFVTGFVALAAEPPVILLWPNGAPGSEGKTAPEAVGTTPQGEHIISSVHRPSVTVYLPSKETASGAAVVIAPGGGHSELWADHEGYNMAAFLSSHGVAGDRARAYRLAREKESTYKVEVEALADTQRAIRLTRSHAADWGINPDRVGVMGFSAGGELAALAATRYDSGNASAADPIERFNSKPSFQGLIYPAIPKDMKLSKDTPPAFLACGENDQVDISKVVDSRSCTWR